ncbi:twin-arginine translocase subunit TatC [Mucilaginibacter sp. E4BP6]|uniref:twin-arginine translocase subunit TatC n=1 Tax=Mucilaginibacter sp. E4BP6 TaxID=2723089 RepID=UPI0015CBCCC6|nr:twin-arginine translocase subunit TatC [Mucilaginibacter sp. E4BP6]NYE64756.1 sec-independent protein translocase protein TatC [Mucilaginibacter sp. E4BP6]
MSEKNIVQAIKDKGKTLESEMSFFDHLEALRWHLMRAAIGVVVCTGFAWYYSDFIFKKIVMAPFYGDFWTYRMMCKFGDGFCITHINGTIINTEMAGQFMLKLNSSILMGVIAAVPYILWEIWRFIKPALLDKERKAASGFVFYASILFIIGILFGYYVIAPESISFLAGYTVSDTIKNQFTVSSYLSMVATITLIIGIVFELPILIYILASIGILTGTFMRKTRRYSVVILLIVGAIISPSPDFLTTMIATVPLFALYEVGIVVASVVEKRRLKKHEEIMES